jgi:hypothetical protein
VTEFLPSSDPSTQKRRSTRIVQAVPITVTGVDALGQPFKERTTTVMVNCHGCKYQSKHYVPKNSMVTLEIPRPEHAMSPRAVQGRVVWVQRPRTVRELFQIGLEFEIAGNVWGIAFPPEDWFPPEGELASAIPSPFEGIATPEAHGMSGHEASPGASIQAETMLDGSGAVLATPGEASTASSEGKIHVVPGPAQTQDSQLAIARQMAKVVAEAKEGLDKSLRRGAEAAITEEMAVVRQQLDAQLHDAVEKAIKVSMERVSESAVKKVVQQAADRTAAIIEEARKTSEVTAEHLDARVRHAVQEAVGHAAEQAAQQAAQQATAQNLTQAVEEAVNLALAEREASVPSLEILSSPEAAQRHLDQWKKDLEETAQSVKNQVLEHSQADASAASRRWQEEFENALTGASQKIREELSEVSQAALTQAEENIASRGASLRTSLDEVVEGAQSTIAALGNALGQDRARAEEMKAQLEEAAKSALEQTRKRLDEVLSAQYEEIGRKADQVIAARAHQMEPALESSAQRILERVSTELDQKLAPKLEEVQKAVSDIANAGEKAAELQSDIRAQIQQATEQALQQSLEHVKQETANIPAEVEKSCREAVSKTEEELEQKSLETQHTTYEALVKASEWYQKKAQTTMQSTLEKAVENSGAALRDRAAEISSMVASELDHYRRTYVEHSQAQIEEAAKDVVERERGKLGEAAQMEGAAFTDRVHRVTAESLQRFEEASREALEKARSDMEYNREVSLDEFQKKMDERLAQGVEHARAYLQTQLLPLMQKWEEGREAQQREWMEQLKKSANESIGDYKSRLENASNSWLLASATTLGQHSQAVLETIAKAAEKRLRETCADVLAGMGDTLKERLLGISSDFTASDDETPDDKK